jgi:hypothetical protein
MPGAFRARFPDGKANAARVLEGSDLEREFRDRDSQRLEDQADAIVAFSANRTVKPSDRCLVFQEAAAAASLTFPSLTMWGARRSVVIRVSNRSAFTLTVNYPSSGSFTVAAGNNALMWSDGQAIRNVQ